MSQEKLAETKSTKSSDKLESLFNKVYKGIHPYTLQISELIWSPLFVIFLWLLHPTYALITLTFIFTFAILTAISNTKNESNTEINQNITIKGLEDTIIATGTTDTITKEIEKIDSENQEKNAHSLDSIIIIKTISKTTRLIGQILIIASGAYLYIGNQISIGGMIAGTLIFGRALQPYESMVLNGKSWIIFYKSIKELRERLKHTYRDSPRTNLTKMQGNINIENALIFHKNTKNIFFQNLNLSIKSGEIISIIGGAGSGKSTLLRCLLGLQTPEIGNITIDNAALTQWGDDLFLNVGYYSSNQQLLPGTLKQNISRYSVSDDIVVNTCKRIGIHRSIINLPMGYDTASDDIMSQLSDAEKQRLLVARAIIMDPAVLILDNADSYQGADGEPYIKKLIVDRKTAGKTTVIASNKPSIISLSDRIIILNNGKIEKTLSPNDLALIGRNKLEISNV
ncbi:peptidase [Amphritea balenae]|nr:peptidase [Amphritea balenae]